MSAKPTLRFAVGPLLNRIMLGRRRTHLSTVYTYQSYTPINRIAPRDTLKVGHLGDRIGPRS